MRISKDITGQRFGRLVALYETKERKGRKAIWMFSCDCGNHIKRAKNGLKNTSSCGCLAVEIKRELIKKIHQRQKKNGYKSQKIYEENAYILYPDPCNRCYAYLGDFYIKNLLCKSTKLQAKDIPQEMVKLKRESLKIKRLIKKRQKEK